LGGFGERRRSSKHDEEMMKWCLQQKDRLACHHRVVWSGSLEPCSLQYRGWFWVYATLATMLIQNYSVPVLIEHYRETEIGDFEVEVRVHIRFLCFRYSRSHILTLIDISKASNIQGLAEIHQLTKLACYKLIVNVISNFLMFTYLVNWNSKLRRR
jgi:hypothetical protein